MITGHEVFEAHRRHLFQIAYRMLGSVAEAEDMVQEASVRWLKLEPEEVHSPRALLTTILTRLCINHLMSAQVRRERYVGPWLPEPLLTDEGPDPDPLEMQESLTMAFLVLLESLSAQERAVFLLCDSFGMSHAEVAATVGVTEANSRQILRRARLQLQARRPRFEVDRAQQQDLMARFSRASRAGDLDALLELFSEDAVALTDGGGQARAALRPVHGRGRVARLVLGALQKFVPESRRTELRTINGRPGLVAIVEERPVAAITADFTSRGIQTLYIVTSPTKLERLIAASDLGRA